MPYCRKARNLLPLSRNKNKRKMEKENNAGFAKVKVQSSENSSTDCNYRGRNQFLKMYYPNGVLIILLTNELLYSIYLQQCYGNLLPATIGINQNTILKISFILAYSSNKLQNCGKKCGVR